MTCHETEPLLNARLDGELDAAGSLGVDRHLSECRLCAAQYDALRNLHQEIAAADIAYTLPSALELKLGSRFSEPKTFPGFLSAKSWRNAFGLAVAVAVLVVAVPMIRNGDGANPIAAEILDNHLRSLQPGHSIDVRSSDQHTVKPWFQGKTSFSPPVPDLTNDGFVLAGGRLEVIHQQAAAAVVYQRRQHVISLYVSPSPGADSKPELRELGGYHLLHWNDDNMSYWAVSDVAPTDLRDFASLVAQMKGSRGQR
ncbi:MAG TPA: anti-sigma factor [Bryobacteraceae bacterium]|jgi:anti-sigma factor RsiW